MPEPGFNPAGGATGPSPSGDSTGGHARTVVTIDLTFNLSRGSQMTRALLVIDVQREYFDGAFPIRHPAGHLGTILEAMDAAKKANVPTVVVRHHQPDPASPGRARM